MRKGWKKATLKEIVVEKGLQTGPFGSQLKASEYVDDSSGVPIIMPQDIYAGKIHLDHIARTSPKKAEKLHKHLVEKGDVLFPRRGDLTRIAVASSEQVGWLCGTGCLRARIKGTIEPDFLGYFFQQKEVHQWLMDNAVGQTMLNLSTEIIGEIPVFLPPLAEQKKIAAILRTWDDAIEKAEKERSQRLRFFNARRRKLVNPDNKISQLKFLSEISSEINRRNDGSDAPVMMISSTQGFIRQDSNYDRDMAGDSLQKYILLQEGEFAYNKGNSKTYPYGCIFRLEVPKALIPFVYICFKLKDGLNPHYFKHYFEAGSLNRQLIRLISSSVRGNGLLNINSDDFFSCKVPVPSKDYQDQCADFLDLAQKEIDILDKKISTLKNQKRGLMQKLLTGAWPVQVDLSKESSSKKEKKHA